jgi:uncharacterized protein YbjT (DUF2867 family)
MPTTLNLLLSKTYSKCVVLAHAQVDANNLEQPGAFDGAVRGVDAVIHTAAPISDPETDCAC